MVNPRRSQRGKKKTDSENLETEPALLKTSSREWKLLTEEKDYFAAKISMYSSFQVTDDIKEKLTQRQKELFAQTCFGQFLQLQQIQFHGQVIHHILLRQLVCPTGENSMWFRIGGKEYEFGLKEFALTTGLDCSEFDLLEVENKLRNRIRDVCFGGKDIVTVKDVEFSFKTCNGDNDEDVVKLAQLYLPERFLIGKDCRRRTENFFLGLVDNATNFNKFPWGKYITYELRGFPYIIQLWAYECIPSVGERVAHRIDRKIPQMLNWATSMPPSFRMLEKEVFNAGELQVKTALQLTEDEMNIEYLCNSSRRKRVKKTNETACTEEGISLGEKAQDKFTKRKKENKSVVEYAQEKVTEGRNHEQSEVNGKIRKNEDESDGEKHNKDENTDTAPGDTHIKEGKNSKCELLASMGKDRHKNEHIDTTLGNTHIKSGKDWKSKIPASTRVEFIASVREQILASVREELVASVKEEFLSSVREEVRKTVREEISRATSAMIAEMRLKMTRSKQQMNVTGMVRVISEAEGKDDFEDECIVKSEPERDNPRTEVDIPCFTIDLFDPPPHNEKEEFDQWIKVGLKRNRKNKYSDTENKLDPAFDLTIDTCKQKDWFFSLNETGQWLNSTHIDVALYFVRMKKKDHPDVFKPRCTTTDWLFQVILNARYPQFKKDPEKFSWDKEVFIQKTLRGIEPSHSLPWIDVETIYIPLNIVRKHWVLLVLDLRRWTLHAYDSYRAAKHDKEVMLACCPIAEMVPCILKSVGFFGARKDIKEATSPLDVELVDGVPQQDNGGDRGMFMLKFTEFMMQNTSLNTCTQDKMPFFWNKMATELYAHGKKMTTWVFVTLRSMVGFIELDRANFTEPAASNGNWNNSCFCQAIL
ncbi:Ulp1 protease family, C-terminal catalytic domain containing protein [Parasponia andersonii]|uniref:Ulp1 protease family, C-terminal catalytic domain containing protein n=1 Tax=Parasponia andersonii TaxID=3476 RepID=A0A2P5AQW5_PARAD|nr:Ulp1 protease family, C-terminal catalytic domain containing protein [Parasponia andersonii]